MYTELHFVHVRPPFIDHPKMRQTPVIPLTTILIPTPHSDAVVGISEKGRNIQYLQLNPKPQAHTEEQWH